MLQSSLKISWSQIKRDDCGETINPQIRGYSLDKRNLRDCCSGELELCEGFISSSILSVLWETEEFYWKKFCIERFLVSQE